MNVVPRDNRMNTALREWPGWVQGWVYSCVDYSCGCREGCCIARCRDARREERGEERGERRGCVSRSVGQLSHARLVPRIQARSWGMGGLCEGDGVGSRSLVAHRSGPEANVGIRYR
jgi:hypothetical protein